MEDKTTKSLDELAKEERRAYYREWRKKNKDKVKQHTQAYWERRAAQKLKEQEE